MTRHGDLAGSTSVITASRSCSGCPAGRGRPRAAGRRSRPGAAGSGPARRRRCSSSGTRRPGRPPAARLGQGEHFTVQHRLCCGSRVTATTSGSRPVMSSRLRVKTRTSSPDRCTWTRTRPACGRPARAGRSCRSRSPGPSTRRQHRLDGGADLQPDAFQTGQSLLEQHGGGRGGRGEQHGRAAYGGHRHSESDGESVLDCRLHRALPELTGDESEQELLLLAGGAAEQRLHRGGPRARRAGPAPAGPSRRTRRRPRRRSRWTRRRGRGLLQRPPAHSGPPLPQSAGQIGHDDLHVVGRRRRGAPPRSGHAWRCATGWRPALAGSRSTD